ncbi:MAG: sigma-54-dependent Fis family transcriptional regulator [Candidatus Hydrogenedentes bacterium]|nr:sigma-54-dependent Fis family transcriptional regulator [Candidatus Hydrogenedentota bacterium]
MGALPANHIVLTENGVGGACAAAAVLMKYPQARLQITSVYHIPRALEALVAEDFSGAAHVCGMAEALPEDAVLEGLQALAGNASIAWYAGVVPPELRAQVEGLGRRVKVHDSGGGTDTEAVLAVLRPKDQARSLLLQEVAEEGLRDKQPRSELHAYCHDLVQAANRRYFFFGDDGLNEKAFRFLAGLEEKSRELDRAVEQYLQTKNETYAQGSSKAIKAMRKMMGRMGPVPEPVLILGPTGSGKELMAKTLHITSGRTGPFVPVNCAVLGGNLPLVEDRLFGHVQGAFTGADSEGLGAFDEADGGTLFLDEIGELPLSVQAQLLRVLEDKEVRPVGSMKTHPVDVRIIAATHRDLTRMVRENRFREDLYYRINLLTLRVPPLRERTEDMKSIAKEILAQLEKNKHPLKLDRRDWEVLHAYEWPGNVRQFLNVLKRAAYLQRRVAEVLEEEKLLYAGKDEDGAGPDLFRPARKEDVVPADKIYGMYVKHVLGLFEGNITQAARALNIAPNTVRKNIEQP